MAEGELTAITAKNVPGLAEQRCIERHDDHVEPEFRSDQHRGCPDDEEDREQEQQRTHP
jgi:hypothetical protein